MLKQLEIWKRCKNPKCENVKCGKRGKLDIPLPHLGGTWELRPAGDFCSESAAGVSCNKWVRIWPWAAPKWPKTWPNSQMLECIKVKLSQRPQKNAAKLWPHRASRKTAFVRWKYFVFKSRRERKAGGKLSWPAMGPGGPQIKIHPEV